MTEAQERDLLRLRRYVQDQQLVSVMNDTKWSELRDLMIEREPRPRYRVLCLLSSPKHPDSWERDWHYHLPTYVWIEWIDIDPVHSEHRGHLLADAKTDMTAELLEALRSRSIPFELQDGLIRIYGYSRSTQPR